MPPTGARHKRQDSDLHAPWIDVPTSSANGYDGPLFSPTRAGISTPAQRADKTSNGRELLAPPCSSSTSVSAGDDALGAGSPTGNGPSEAVMRFRGHRVKVKLTLTHVSWKPLNPHSGCCIERRRMALKIPFEEVLSAMPLAKPSMCCCPRDHQFVLYSFSRRPSHPATWLLEEHVLGAPSAEAARDWVATVNARIMAVRDRPRSLLVFVNPYSGARRARHVWERQVLPVFTRARIKVHAVETTKQDHAKEHLAYMKGEELASYQGVVAVGGDGLFQEVVSGLLARRARGCAAAYRTRAGHVPAGSTDAVAYTLHGTRCATTAALHIALGDRLALDAGRVEVVGGGGPGAGQGSPPAPPPALPRFFVCQAAYGFLGDVMKFSERLRFMGPARYDVTGALQYLKLSSYRVALSYREAPSTAADVQQLCTVACEVCRMAGIRVDLATSSNSAAATGNGMAGTPAQHQPLHQQQHPQQGNTAGSPRAANPPLHSPFAGTSSAAPNGSSSAHASQPGQGQGPGSGARSCGVGGMQQQEPQRQGSQRQGSQPLPTSTPPSGPLGGAGGGGGEGPLGQPFLSLGYPGQQQLQGPGLSHAHSAHSSSSSSHPHIARGSSGQCGGCGEGPGSYGGGGAGIGEAAGGGAGGGSVHMGSRSNTPTPVGGAAGGKEGAAGGGSRAGTGTGMGSACGEAAGRGKRGGGEGAGGAGEGGVDAEGWTHVEGEFVSVMCVVTPCRSDKSKRGIIPNGHLSDGRMYLVLVSRCSHVSMLRFLIRLSTKGLADRCLPFVRVIPITALRLSPLPGGHKLGGCLWDGQCPESAWNVDGELLASNTVSVSVARGAVEVFARGLEVGGRRSGC